MAKAEGSFKTHAAYMDALAGAADLGPWGDAEQGLKDLAERAAVVFAAGGEHPEGTIDQDQLRRSLTNAWSTELLIDLALSLFDDDETIRVANHWAVIQAYYVLYHLSQALVVARGRDRPDSHPSTVRAFASDWLDRNLDLRPWTLGLNSKGWRNPAAEGPPDAVHQWSSTSDYNVVGMLIRTTRERELGERWKAARQEKQRADQRAWRKEEAERLSLGKRPRKEPQAAVPRLSAGEKAAVDRKLGTFGVMHYLWRLRIKSNYLDPDTFIEGPPDTTSSSAYLSKARYFLATTCLVHELRIGSLVGMPTLDGWATSWGKEHASGPSGVWSLGPTARAELLRALR